MGFPWKQLVSIGEGVASLFVPGLVSTISVVEQNLSGLKGPDKKSAAIAMAQSVVTTIDATAGKDVLSAPAVVDATSKAVDAVVAAENAKAALVAAIQAAEAATKPAPVVAN